MERNTGLLSARAFAKASSPHGYKSTGLSLCWSRYGEDSSARRLATRRGYRRRLRGRGRERRLDERPDGEVAEAIGPRDVHPPLLRLGGDRDLVFLVPDRHDVAGVELVQPPEDVARRDRLIVREQLDEAARKADVDVAVPVVPHVDEDRAAVLTDLDLGVVGLDQAGLLRGARVRGVQELAGGDVALVPGRPDVAVEGVIDMGQAAQLGEQRDRNVDGDLARLVAVLGADVDAEPADPLE